jgi:hypothetical protein
VAEDLVLLALDPASGKELRSVRPQVLGGALLVDLGLLGLVRVEPGGFLRRRRVTVTGAAPADPLLGPALTRVAGRSGTPLEVGRWLGEGARDALLHRLAARGVLRREEGRTLGFRRVRWPAAGTGRRDAVVHEARGVLLDGATAHPRSAALAAVLVQTGLARSLLPLPRRARLLDPRSAHGHLGGFDPALADVLDACVDACGDSGGGGDGGDGGDGGGGGGGD